MSSVSNAADVAAVLGLPAMVMVAGEAVRVSGVLFADLPQLAEEAAAAGATGGEDTLFLSVLNRSVKRSPDWWAGLAEAEFDAVMEAFYRVNSPLFETAQPAAAGRAETASWVDVVARLVQAGHSIAAIKGYTLLQMDVLSKALDRVDADQALDALSIARTAQADDKSYRKVLADMRRVRAKLAAVEQARGHRAQHYQRGPRQGDQQGSRNEPVDGPAEDLAGVGTGGGADHEEHDKAGRDAEAK